MNIRLSPIFRGLVLSALSVFASVSVHAQQPLLSPRDSVELKLGSARIFIDYGRPSMRGRKIMGGLVPYNVWWRTGANEATSFRTSADILLGDSLIPAGTYTMYTLPSEKRWRLIINKQTGQWGTIYNDELDLVRIPMKKKSLRKDVQKFTILLDKTGPSSGVLRLVWERTEVWLPFRLRNGTHENGNGRK